MTPFPSLNSSLQGFRIHSNPLSWYLTVFIQPRCHVKGKRRCYNRRLKRVYVQCDSVFDLVRFSDAQFWKQMFDLFHTASYFRSLMTISFNSNLFCLISIVMLTYNHVILTLIVFSFDLPIMYFPLFIVCLCFNWPSRRYTQTVTKTALSQTFQKVNSCLHNTDTSVISGHLALFLWSVRP